ncbi:hypothetical protein [Saccharopolyspora shandongensis]|uniref:hypothetical protein n=1 Tax=Saccharopolyspora shandongensis TaxID=418495 RepID=UPI0033F73067
MSTSHDAPSSPETLFDREVSAFHRTTDEQTTATVTCTRRGPGPGRAMQAPPTATVYTLTVRVEAHSDLDMTVDAATPWDALTHAREHLEQHGWFLAIAAARRDCWPIQLPRQHEATTVTELTGQRNPRQWQGFLASSDPGDVGSVAEQQHHYQIWLSRYDTTPGG